jgi:hypothetical protein
MLLSLVASELCASFQLTLPSLELRSSGNNRHSPCSKKSLTQGSLLSVFFSCKTISALGQTRYLEFSLIWQQSGPSDSFWKLQLTESIKSCSMVVMDRLYGLMVRVSGSGSRSPGSIPNATRFQEK